MCEGSKDDDVLGRLDGLLVLNRVGFNEGCGEGLVVGIHVGLNDG